MKGDRFVSNILIYILLYQGSESTIISVSRGLGVSSEILYKNIKMQSLEEPENNTQIKIKLKKRKVRVQN